MSAAVLENQSQVRRERRPCGGHGSVTLGQLLTRAHEAVRTSGTAACPVCGGHLAADGVDARCGDCGSRLG